MATPSSPPAPGSAIANTAADSASAPEPNQSSSSEASPTPPSIGRRREAGRLAAQPSDVRGGGLIALPTMQTLPPRIPPTLKVDLKGGRKSRTQNFSVVTCRKPVETITSIRDWPTAAGTDISKPTCSTFKHGGGQLRRESRAGVTHSLHKRFPNTSLQLIGPPLARRRSSPRAVDRSESVTHGGLRAPSGFLKGPSWSFRRAYELGVASRKVPGGPASSPELRWGFLYTFPNSNV